ncbi:MAG: response regulator [Alphaproteobacteria bacterium]|nr:response regulator [Alphaproteobacteria bacterium]
MAGGKTAADATSAVWPFLIDAPIGMARIDRRGRIHEHNRFFLGFLEDGEGTEATVGRALADLVSGDHRAGVVDAIAQMRRDDGSASDEETLEVAFGGDGQTFASLILRPDPQHGIDPKAFVVAYAIDVTERRLLETQFAQSQKMQAVGQLAGGVAHDFNNLLTAMTGFCDLLLQRHGPGDQSFADVMQIKQNTNRAANLVRQLLAFSRQQTLIPRVVDLTEVLADLSHLLRRLIGENVSFELIHGRDLRPVKVDPGQLEQVLINLVVNARDAMPSGGTITLHTGNTTTVKPLRQGDEVVPPGSYVLIEVVDTGSGIPPALLARIFEPFFTTKEVGQGTGLGLSTAFGIIKQFGGFVFVDSTAGVGTTFSIYLPAWDGPVDVVEVSGDAGIDQDLTGSGTVLLVEDEDPVRLFAARALRSKGYTVIEARSGEAVLELLDREAPVLDLMVTDVVMPGIDGPALVKIVSETRPDLPVVCISGYSEDALRQRIADTKGMAFLPKPFSLKQLAQAVKQAIARSRTTS